MAQRILIVEDERDLRDLLRRFLGKKGYEVSEASTVKAAMESVDGERPDLVLVDYRLPDGTAFEVIRALEAQELDCPSVVMTGHGTIDLAVEAMKRGADHFITKPVDLESLHVLVRRVLDGRRRRRREEAARAGSQARAGAPTPFVGPSASMRRVQELAQAVVDSEAPVLITGETGTGKGVLANWLHANGPRATEPFVDLNCSGLPRELAESELFGHQKGSFTNATANKPGLVEIAHRGTLFLDEIGDLDTAVQPKLLKVLEEQTYRKVGDVRARKVDVRLIAATHRNLGEMTKDGSFRSDLLFRINTITFELPPLRERRDDLEVLATRLLASVAPSATLDPAALGILRSHSWPGNIRELRNALERAALLSRGGTIGPSHLHLDGPPEDDVVGQPRTLQEVERVHILSVLREAEGHVERAAEVLGIPRSSLYAKLKRFGVRASEV